MEGRFTGSGLRGDSMNTPKAIIFDWDGTLVDTLDFVFSAHNHVRGVLGEPLWSREEFKVHTKKSSVELYPILYGDRSDYARDVLAAFMHDNHLKPENLVMMPGTREFLDAARQKGIPMSVLSNKKHVFLESEVDYMGLRDYFQMVVGAGALAGDKGSGVALLELLKQQGMAPGPDALMVGDTETDILCGHGAGCSVAFLHQEKDHADVLVRHKPAIIVRDIVELKQNMFLPVPA